MWFSFPVTTVEPERDPLQHSDVVLEFSPDGEGFTLVVLLQMLPRRKKPTHGSHDAGPAEAGTALPQPAPDSAQADAA